MHNDKGRQCWNDKIHAKLWIKLHIYIRLKYGLISVILKDTADDKVYT